MIILGALLLGVGFIVDNIVFDIAGVLILALGAGLLLAGRRGHTVGGRRHYY
ncbi:MULTISPECIES: DUF6131 family protein [unclassified Nocardia]|uniref:DUF6131 family protein n=1 Tax=unclassified Nocardia TaxID=2637762 RepID=UPI0024A9D3C3|nr:MULTISPECIES: DUF6131 family protein [unclassified Nocardia]